MLSKKTFISIGLILLNAFIALAQSGSDSPVAPSTKSIFDSIHSISEIKVVKSRQRVEIIPVQTLSGKQLQGLSSYSVADALRYFAGVQIKDYGGIGGLKTINIRSMGSQHVGVFYDGIEISNPQNGVVDLGKFSLDNMESVTLYNGQKSAIFQSAKDFASASSIYLTSRRPRFEDYNKYRIKTTFKTGSFGLANPSVLVDNRLSDRIVSSFNADYLYSNGKYKFTKTVTNPDDPDAGGYRHTDTRRNGDINVLRLEHALFGVINNGEWKTRVYGYLSERGLPGSVVRRTKGEYKNEDRQRDRNFFVQSSLRKGIGDSYMMRLTGKYGYDYLHYVSDPSKGDAYYNNRYRVHELYLSSANYYNILPFLSVNISVDYQWNKMDSDIVQFIYPRRNTWLAAAATSLETGSFKLQASLLVTFINETFSGNNNPSKQWHKYTPSLIASWQPIPDEDLHIRAFYKRIFRMPTFNELYLTFIGSGRAVLDPEHATQYNLGFTYAKKPAFLNSTIIGLQADGYYNEITDKLISRPGGVMFRWSMFNLGRVKIWGSDVTLWTKSEFGKQWSLETRFSYTYQDARDYSRPHPSDENGSAHVDYKGRISYIPEHSGSSIITLGYKKWLLNYSFIYTGKRYTDSDNKVENLIMEWYTSDLGISRTFNVHKTRWKASAEVNNIFNQQYDVVLNFPMPGTNVKFSLSVEF